MHDRSRAVLEITLLGPPVVSWAGAVLPVARRQTRALFYRLAAELVPIPRSQLGFLFWPDVPESEARRNLTHLLTLLRQVLPQPIALITDATTVALNPELVWSDTTSFVHLTRTSAAPNRPAALAAALDLYRGPLLDGFALAGCPEFEAWLDTERHVWERRIDDALATVIETHTVAGNYGAAIALARRALARDPLAEELHRRLIALYAATGDRTAALRQFEQCVVVLERELGVSPLPETRTVYQSVRDGVSPLPLAAASRSAAVGTEPAPQLNTIPVSPTQLIGRAVVLAEVLTLLHRADVRVLTLAGPGGAGKTRLALEIARIVQKRFSDGVAVVPLAPLRDAALVPQAIAEALGLGERDNRPPLLRLKDLLRERELLLVLDNCEHVLDAAATLAELLAAAPGLTLLTTSRELLRIAGEQTYQVPPLELPDLARPLPPAELARVGAVALFVARVRERTPMFALTDANATDVAAICAQLDGLPLAIELAAARAALLSPRMLRARLDRRLTLLIDGPRDLPERQRTLRATIDWSYALLDMREQLLLGRLAVFAGGWTLQAAEQISVTVGPLAVSVLDGMHALLNKSLIQRTAVNDGEPRFSMLETIREYALERLTERGEAELAQVTHASYFVELAAQAELYLHGPDQLAWFDRLDQEHANLRVALAWLLESGAVVGALQIAADLYHFWYVRGHFGEGCAWLSQALGASSLSPDGAPMGLAHILARARFALGHLTLAHGDLRAALDQLLSLAADLRARAAATGNDADTQRLLIQTIVRVLQAEGMLGRIPPQDEIDELLALSQEFNDQRAMAEHALNYGRGMLHGAGRPDLARPTLARAEVLFSALGDVWTLALLRTDFGILALLDGDLDEARRNFEQAQTMAIALRDRFLEAEALNNLGEIARMANDDRAAETHYTASMRLCRQLGSQVEAQWLIHNLAYLALHRGERDQAHAGFAASLAGFRQAGQQRGHAESVAGLACVAAHLDQAGRAARLWGAADAAHTDIGTAPWPVDRAERTRYERLARTQLGDAAYAAAYTAGAALTLDQAVAEALIV